MQEWQLRHQSCMCTTFLSGKAQRRRCCSFSLPPTFSCQGPRRDAPLGETLPDAKTWESGGRRKGLWAKVTSRLEWAETGDQTGSGVKSCKPLLPPGPPIALPYCPLLSLEPPAFCGPPKKPEEAPSRRINHVQVAHVLAVTSTDHYHCGRPTSNLLPPCTLRSDRPLSLPP